MESPMLKRIKTLNPDKEYPKNLGKPWSNKEETQLLDEVSKNIDMESISQIHERTLGGIVARIKEIAYKMYLKDCSFEEIMETTKLDNNQINETIERKQIKGDKNKYETVVLTPQTITENKCETVVLTPQTIDGKITENKYKYEMVVVRKNRIPWKSEMKKDIVEVKEELNEIKNNMVEIKKTLKELTEMINAVYEFEH
jgi:hypothetical protein